MRVIFLDIDGVLNNRGFMTHDPVRWEMGHRFKHLLHHNMDPRNVATLQEIISRTNAKLVISSTWRMIHTLEEITSCLRHHGCSGEVIDKTVNGYYDEDKDYWYVRGDQIQLWLDEHQGQVESFVILDDDSDMVHLMDKLVHTKFDYGLRKEHIEPAVKILLGQ
jgi:hypothetical protein